MPRSRTKTSSPRQRGIIASPVETETQKSSDVDAAPRRSARMAARSEVSPAGGGPGEVSRSRRSSTAAQTAASVAEARMTRSRSTRDDSSSPASDSRTRSGVRESPLESPATRVKTARRSTSKVNYEESDGEEDATPSVTKGEEEEYRTEEDSDIESDNEKPSRSRTRTRTSPRSPPKAQRGRGRPPARSRRLATKTEDDDDDRDESEDAPAGPITPTRTRYGRESKKVKQEEEGDKGTGRRPARASPRTSQAAATPASRPVRAKKKAETAALPASAGDEPPSRRSTRVVRTKRVKDTEVAQEAEDQSAEEKSEADVEMEAESLDQNIDSKGTKKHKLSDEAELEEKPAKRSKRNVSTSGTDEGDNMEVDISSKETPHPMSQDVQNEAAVDENKDVASEKINKEDESAPMEVEKVEEEDRVCKTEEMSTAVEESEVSREGKAQESGTSGPAVPVLHHEGSQEPKLPETIEIAVSSESNDSIVELEKENVKNWDLDTEKDAELAEVPQYKKEISVTKLKQPAELELPPSETEKEDSVLAVTEAEQPATHSVIEQTKHTEAGASELESNVEHPKPASHTDVLDKPPPANNIELPESERRDQHLGLTGAEVAEGKTDVPASEVRERQSDTEEQTPLMPLSEENTKAKDHCKTSTDSQPGKTYAVPSDTKTSALLESFLTDCSAPKVSEVVDTSSRKLTPPDSPSENTASRDMEMSAQTPALHIQDCQMSPESRLSISPQNPHKPQPIESDTPLEVGDSEAKVGLLESGEHSSKTEETVTPFETEAQDRQPMELDPSDRVDNIPKIDGSNVPLQNNCPGEVTDCQSTMNGANNWLKERLPQEKATNRDDSCGSLLVEEDAHSKANGTNDTSDTKVCNNITDRASAVCGRKFISVPDLEDHTKVLLRDRTFQLVSHCFSLNVGDSSVQCEKFLSEVKSMDADVLCLQNVHEAYFAQKLEQSLDALGYRGIFAASEGQTARLGTFYRSSAFRLVSHASVSLRNLIDKDLEASSLDAIDKSAVRAFLQKCGHILFTRLASLLADKTLTIANVYIPLTDVSTHALQTSCLVRELVTMGEGVQSPHVLCGVFNTAEGGPAYQLLRDGYLSNEMIEELQCRKEIPLPGKENVALVNLLWKAFQHPSSGLQSCYASVLGHEAEKSGSDGKVHASPDLLWFSSDTLRVLGVLDTDRHSSHRAVLKADLAFLN